MTEKCQHCLDQIHNEDGVWVDNSNGDVCGNYGTYTNEPHIPAPDVVGCKSCGNETTFVEYDETYCDRCVADAENENRYAVSDYWRA
jgi:hypothetical protein